MRTCEEASRKRVVLLRRAKCSPTYKLSSSVLGCKRAVTRLGHLEIEFQSKLNLSLRVACTVSYTEIRILDGGIQATAQHRVVECIEELRPELKSGGLS